jgi:GH18 family chitinase
MPLDQVRGLFDDDIEVCMAVGGWGDNAGFTAALATKQSRQTFATNLANELDRLGYDCVGKLTFTCDSSVLLILALIDIDYEYPGGNGADWKQVPNTAKAFEIEAFPLLLEEIKTSIAGKELAIAVPGRQVDMIAFTLEQTPKINQAVDHVNVCIPNFFRHNVTFQTNKTMPR